MRIGVLASHNGTTLQAVIDACETGQLDAEIVVVISNNADSGAGARAHTHGVPFVHLSSRTHPDPDALDDAILDTLNQHGTELVLLAGYMKKIGVNTLHAFRGRMINTHPSLLPKYGGQGMYGRRVFEAVMAAGERVTGISIHQVTAEYDDGPIVAQCEVEIGEQDTVEGLMARVQARERAFLVETLQVLARQHATGVN